MNSKGASRKTIQISILVIVLLIGGYSVGMTLFKSSETAKTGEKPPAFELLDMEGNIHRLSDYEGKPLIINFWGTFCPPCVKEMPEFQRQYMKWRENGLEVLAINLSEDDLTVTNFLRRFELDYTILRDKNKITERQFGVSGYPTTYFVNADGYIEEIFVGGMSEEDIDVRVTRLFENE